MNGDIASLFQGRIRGLKQSGANGQFTGFCPAHDDRKPSLSINVGTDGHILLHCHAGCSVEDIVQALGLTMSDLFPDNTSYQKGGNDSPQPGTVPTNQATKEEPLPEAEIQKAREWYTYIRDNFDRLTKDLPWTREAVKKAGVGYDPDTGRFIYVHRDSQGKVLNIKHGKGKGGQDPYSVQGYGQTRLYPAHLIKDYAPDLAIYCEGEPDVVTLLSHDFQAVTGTNGAESIPPDLRPPSKFKAVVVIMDNDKAGRDGSVKIADAILAQCPETEVCISYWPEDSSEGYDITDFFQDGGTADGFEEQMLKELPIYQPTAPESPAQPRDFPQFSPRLDPGRLTPALREFLSQAAPTTDAPDEFLISAYLTHWAGVVGNKLFGPPDHLRPNVWIVLFAGSGEMRKSKSLSEAGRPSREVQKRYNKGLKDGWTRYESELLIWDSLLKEQRAEAPKPGKPIVHKLLLSVDFSDAGFYMELKQNPISGVIVASEFADFHRKLNRDMTAQADAFLSAYDNETMSRHTRQYGLEVIEDPTFSILGATTFENFRRVFRASELETGFFQRVFPVAIPSPTKERKLFLQRSEMEWDFIQKEANHIKAWLDHPGDMEVVIPSDTTEAFSAWETGFVSGARGKYGERIGPHVERMVPGCLKLAMLCESLEVEKPEGLTTLTLSLESLLCAQMLVENLFLPSVNYLLEEEIVYGRERMNEKKVERALKVAGGTMDRTALIRETRLSSKEMDEVIYTLQDKGFLEVLSEHQERKQGGGNPRLIYTWIGE